MRCYVPASRSMLVTLTEGGPIPAGTHAYAVTPALLTAMEAAAGGPESEEAEYAAFQLAAEASVLLLDRSDPVDRRRVVLAVDAAVEPTGASDDALGEVRLRQAVHRNDLAAVHVDSDDVRGEGALVDQAVNARDVGDEEGLERALAALADVDLGWYLPSELESLP